MRFDRLEQLHALREWVAATMCAPSMARWARFLQASTAEELHTLAQEDPVMEAAKRTLEELSRDPEAWRIANDREASEVIYRDQMASSRDEGRDEGLVVGRAEGARATLVRLLSKRFGPLPSWAEEQIARAEQGELEAYADAVLAADSLEAVLKQGLKV
jgi:hypothetical protein